jgi:hypothetical protein
LPGFLDCQFDNRRYQFTTARSKRRGPYCAGIERIRGAYGPEAASDIQAALL